MLKHIMRFWRYGTIIVGLWLCVGAPNVLANTDPISNDPVHAEQFSFYCGPYLFAFEEGNHYSPENGHCIYSIPSTITGTPIIGLYRGVPGNSTLQSGDGVFSEGTLIKQEPNVFSSPVEDEDYFAVVYDIALDGGSDLFDVWLETGGEPPAGAVEDGTYYLFPWKWGAKPTSEFDPVVVVPGILGSWEKNGEWVLDPITHIYDNLVDTFLANGYVEGETLFKFAYDWRKSNAVTANLLGQKIKEIKEVCDCVRVDLVGHSMGGLVISDYVTGESYTGDVDQVFFVGTPFGGSPKAYKTWEGGEVDFGDDIANLLMQRVFEREARDNGLNSVFDYLHSGLVPSVEQLLPVFTDYLRVSEASPYLVYPDGYPQNGYLEGLLVNIGQHLYDRVRPYGITGYSFDTPSGFVVKPSTQLPKWEHGEPIQTDFSDGDETVTTYSAQIVFGPDKEFTNINHTQLASTSAPYIFERLNNKQVGPVVGNVYEFLDIDFPTLIKKLSPSSGDFRVLLDTLIDLLPISQTTTTASKILLILLFSPIDAEIIAPDGKRVGKDVVTDTILNEIPNALYSGPDAEHEYVIILDPLPGEYKVKTKGTGSGSYTVAAGYADSATTSESFVEGTTTEGQIIENTMILSSTTTIVTIEEDSPPPSEEEITPKTCVADMQLAYKNKWIKKKQVYNALVADCKLLGVLFVARDKANREWVRKGIVIAIKLTLAHMDKLAKDKGNTEEAVELITKNTTWFREHEL